MEYLVVLFGSLVPPVCQLSAHKVTMMTPSDQIVSLAIRTSSLNPEGDPTVYIYVFGHVGSRF